MESPQNPVDFQVGLKLYLIVITKIIVGCFYVLFLLLKFANTFKSNMGMKYFISIIFVLNFLVIYSNFQSVDDALRHSAYGYDSVTLQSIQEFIDLGDNAILYRKMLVTCGAAMTVLMIRAVFLLTFFRAFEAIISTIETQYLQLVASFVMLGLVLVGFAFVGMSLWGQHLVSFSSFGRAVLSLLLITMGCYNQQSVYQYSVEMTLVYMLFFYFFIFSFMFNILAVIYIDSYRYYIQLLYRLLLLEQGELQQELWTSTDWFLWALSWVPESIQKRCNNAIE